LGTVYNPHQIAGMPGTRGPKTLKGDKKTKGREAELVVEDGLGGRIGMMVGGREGVDVDVCVDCGRKVAKTQPGMQCDGCGFWHHPACEKMDDDVYEFLQEHNGEPSLLWYCKKCVMTSKKVMTMMMMMCEQQQQLEERVKEMSQNMQQKLSDIVERLDSRDKEIGETVGRKMDNLATEICKKLESPEQSPKQTGVESKRVEEKLDAFIDTVKQKIEVNSSVGEVVSSKLKEDKEEAEEIRQRRANIIVHGVKESTNEDPEIRKKEDESQITNLLHDVKCDDVSVSGFFRLGKKSTDTDANPRPLKIVLVSEEQKEKILKGSKNLRNNKTWEKVFINQDLTPKQREQRRQLVKEMKRRQAGGETNLMIVNNRIVSRRQRTEREEE